MRGINHLKGKNPAEVLIILDGVNPKKDVRYGIFGGRSFAVEGVKISLNAFLRYSQADKSIAEKVRVLDAASLQAPDRHLFVRLLQPLWKILHAVRSFFSGSGRERAKLLTAIESKKEPATPPSAGGSTLIGTPFLAGTPSPVTTSPAGLMSPTQLTRMPKSPSPIKSQADELTTTVDVDAPQSKLDVYVFELTDSEHVDSYRKIVADQMQPLPEKSVRYMLVELNGNLVLYRFVRLEDAYKASEPKGHLFKAEGFTLQMLSEHIEKKWGQVVTNEDFIE